MPVLQHLHECLIERVVCGQSKQEASGGRLNEEIASLLASSAALEQLETLIFICSTVQPVIMGELKLVAWHFNMLFC